MKSTARCAAVVVALVSSVLVHAQTGTGELRGVVSSVRGPLAGLEVRIKNTSTGEVKATTTSPTGEYSMRVTPGRYDIFASQVGYGSLALRDLEVRAGAVVTADGVMPDNPNAGTPGEIYFLYDRAGKTPPTGPAPKAADGKPDLSGIWLPGQDLEPEVPPFQPWAAEAARKYADRPGDDPRAQCLPSGVTRMHALDLVKFVQTPTLLIALIESAVPPVRQIFLDGRSHPPNLQPTWMGHSIGRWEADTLVIDTIGFNDKVWLEGIRPQTEQLHVIERYRRIDVGRMSLEITIDDPGAYTRPWKVRRLLQLAPGEEVQEYICNENHKTEHFVGGGNH
jgi:carboxypeptidase family protein